MHRMMFSPKLVITLGVDIFAYVFAHDWNNFLAIQEELLFGIMDIVREAGAEIAFPSQSLYLEADKSDKQTPALRDHRGRNKADALNLTMPSSRRLGNRSIGDPSHIVKKMSCNSEHDISLRLSRPLQSENKLAIRQTQAHPQPVATVGQQRHRVWRQAISWKILLSGTSL